MPTIKNRKKEPLRGSEIIQRFPKGLSLRAVVDPVSKRRVVDVSINPRLIQDPKNPNESWWVDVLSLFEETEREPRDIKPEFADYPLVVHSNWITLR